MAIPQWTAGAVALTQLKTLSCVRQCTAIISSVLNGPHCPTYLYFINIYITAIWPRGSDDGTTTKTENRQSRFSQQTSIKKNNIGLRNDPSELDRDGSQPASAPALKPPSGWGIMTSKGIQPGVGGRRQRSISKWTHYRGQWSTIN